MAGDESRFEEERLDRLDRGGVTPPIFCRELTDLLLCNIGVDDRLSWFRELELGVRRTGEYWGTAVPGEETFRSGFGVFWGDPAGDEAGSGVAEAVPNERLWRESERDVASLFVVCGLNSDKSGSCSR